MRLLLLLLCCLLARVRTECYNACSGHGRCTVYDMCVCHRNWQSNDCSERVCQFGLAFVDSPKGDLDASGSVDGPAETVAVNSFVYPYGTSEGYPDMRDTDGRLLTQSGHAYAECSNAGICDRRTGLCVCQEGFEGVACQRLQCPSYKGYPASSCSGHGHCRSMTSIVASSQQATMQSRHDAYALWDRQLSTACVCDPGFFGGDCHMRRCKLAVDPLYMDDFSMVSYGRYYLAFLMSRRNATTSDGFGGQGYFRVRIFDNEGQGWLTKRISYPATCSSLVAALEDLPHRLIPRNKTLCTMSTKFDLDPLARRPAWRISTTSRYKAYFENNPRAQYRTVHPTFWAQRFLSSSAANSSADQTLTGHIFLLEFHSLVGDVRQPETVLYSDGRRATLVPSSGQLFTNIWTDGQRAEAVDHFSALCHHVTVRIDTTHSNYHFLTGFSVEEKLQLMQCLADADLDPSNNLAINGRRGYSWDTGSANFPHLVRMVRVVSDVLDSGYYVAMYYDTSVTDLDTAGFGSYANSALLGTFRLLHPFESLDHLDAVQYYVFTTKGTMQIAGGKTEAAFDFASFDFFTTNQSHVIDTGVYWRVNETQTVELAGTDVDEVQVIRVNTASAPEIQTVTVSTARSAAQQRTGVLIESDDLASAIAAGSCAVGAKCAAIEARLSGSVTFRFDPTYCGSSGKTVSADSNLCLQALAELGRPTTGLCPTASSCLSATLTVPFTAAALKTALCGILAADGTTKLMQDGQSTPACVTVTDLSQLMATAIGPPTTYQYAFQVDFVGDTLQGDVPSITVYAGSIVYTCASAASVRCNPTNTGNPVVVQGYKANYAAEDGWTPVSKMHRAGSAWLKTRRGNQADGFYSLGYTCEGKWTSVTLQTARVAAAEHFAEVVTITSGGGVQLRLGHVFRSPAHNTYHLVTALDASCTYAACLRGTVTPAIWVKFSTTGGVVTGELGVFYSDPGKQDPMSDSSAFFDASGTRYLYSLNTFGVSYACRAKNYKASAAVSPYATAAEMRALLLQVLVSLSPTQSSGLTVTRTASTLTGVSAASFGFTYSITFTHSPGDVFPLKPKTSSIHTIDAINLWPTQTLGTMPTVVVATVQDGSMLYDGYFSLTQTYPHAYLGTPATTSVTELRWNILPEDLHKVLAPTQAWADITVTRSAFVASTATRWAGGYVWTITYTKRNGAIPAMGIAKSLVQVTTSAASVTTSSIEAVTGTASAPLPTDDPGTSRRGNQVGGTFGFAFTDSLGNPYSSSNTMFSVVDSGTGMPLTAAAFRTQLMTMLGNRRQTSVKVTRSAGVNAVMGYTYTVEFQGKELRGRQMSLNPDSSLLTKTAASGSVSVAVSEVVAGRNDTVFNHQYAGQISCESSGIVPSLKYFANNTLVSACLAKGDLFLVLDPYTPSNNPPYLNLHRAVSVYALPQSPNLGARYPRMSQTELSSLATYKRFVVQSDLASNWAQDTSSPATFRFFKFWPHEDTSFNVVAECGNRGMCNHFEGLCDCFHGYSGDGCTTVESLAI